ncbi:MAG TPA: homoserine kinase [Pseudonocardiaceae bacterium]|nr:homoserine kinase [Pseudonocardiaceae bacterium]
MPLPAVRVRVPASTANLGPGFDALGLALALYDEVEVTPVASGLRVEVRGEGAGQVPTDEEHLVVRALRAACARFGCRPDGLVLRCHNNIPHSRGLGSSAAAAVAGVLAGYALAGRKPDGAVLDLAAGFDGHADNAGASLLGGLAISWRDEQSFRAIRLEPHPDLVPVLLVPEETSATKVTRGLLPAEVPHSDAAFTAGRAALLVHALTAAPQLLLAATEDRLHQPYRRTAYPATGRLVDALRAAGVPAAVSGAGPTVLAFPTRGELPTVVHTTGFARYQLDVARDGAVVVARDGTVGVARDGGNVIEWG